MTPQAESRVEKPDTDTYCPASGNKLRLKDLIPVKFTKVPTDSESEGRFMDPVTKVSVEIQAEGFYHNLVHQGAHGFRV